MEEITFLEFSVYAYVLLLIYHIRQLSIGWWYLNKQRSIMLNELPSFSKSIQLKMDYLERIKNHICTQNKIKKNISIVVEDENRLAATAYVFLNIKFICFSSSTINILSHKELGAVLAHEISHIKDNTLYRFLFPILNHVLILTSALVSFWFFKNFVFENIIYVLSFSSMVTALVTFVLDNGFDILGNYLSRKEEYRADVFSAKNRGIKPYLEQRKMFDNDYLRKPGFFRKLKDSHPDWTQRVEFVKINLGIK